MKWGGILAGALQGGAQAIGMQATDNIASQSKAQMAQLLSDIEEARQRRIEEFREQQRRGGMEADFAFRNRPDVVDTEIGSATKKAEAAGKVARGLKVAEATDPDLRAAEDQRAADETERKRRGIETLTPAEVKRATALTEAEARAKAKFREQPPSVQKKVSDIEKALGRELTEQEKLLALGLVKGGGESDTVKITEETPTEGGGMRKVERTEKRKPGQQQSGGDVLADARAAIAKGADPAKVNERLKSMGYEPIGGATATAAPSAPTRKDPISGQSLTEKEWDRKYGKGDFRNLYKPGEPSLKAF